MHNKSKTDKIVWYVSVLSRQLLTLTVDQKRFFGIVLNFGYPFYLQKVVIKVEKPFNVASRTKIYVNDTNRVMKDERSLVRCS